jgi:hypothetical protein
MSYSLNHSGNLSAQGDNPLSEGLADYSTRPSRRRTAAYKPDQSVKKPSQDSHVGTSRLNGSGRRPSAADPRSTLPEVKKGDVGEPAERAAPRKKRPAQSLPQRASGKARKRPCVLCGRIFKPTPESSSTRKYCKTCRQTRVKETSKAVSSGKKQKATSAADICRRCGQPVPKGRKSREGLCEACERPAQPVSRAKNRRPRSNSVRAILCGSPGLGKRR